MIPAEPVAPAAPRRSVASVLTGRPPAPVVTKTAAPPAKPPATTTTAPTTLGQLITTPLDMAPIIRHAHAQALADTGAVIGQLRANQAAIDAQAAQRAQQATLASKGAAGFLAKLGLGPALEKSYVSAAGDQASLASGFSGELQRTVGNEGAQVAAAMKALGAPGGAPSSAAQAGNAVYGVGGALPANAMLAEAPSAVALANQGPTSLLAEGRQAALGTIGAGQQRAAQIDQQIGMEAAKTPALESRYVSQFTTSAEKTRQDTIGNVLKLASQQSTDAYRQTQAQARADALNATNAYRQGLLSHDAYTAETARINANLSASKVLRPSASLSKVRGIVVDSNGTPITGKDGQPIVVPGFTIDPKTGQPVKAPTVSATISSGLINDTAKVVSSWKSGQTGTNLGAPVYDPSKQLTYSDALTRAIARGPDTPQWVAQATKIVNAEYGTPQKIALTAATTAKASGHGATEAVTLLLQAQAAGKAVAPLQYLLPALAKVYGMRPADVNAIAHQVAQLMASGQVAGG